METVASERSRNKRRAGAAPAESERNAGRLPGFAAFLPV
ncbi:hypothetical protein GLE_4901 [Lysobacter enzymogenes]|uniref:Uncharacterized protein n=1 Tax=Lysobacter enzymogenes TaxID=69 RepID=A0A0S2DNS7_LYSEN|nr:hypothetical protein GLE_4901 [Lysobacter enzymogenes]